MFDLVENEPQNAVIKLIGLGGGGGNAVSHMVENNIDGVDFICANTDAQALKNVPSKISLQIGASITKGLGAGADPDIGRQAALEDRERIQEAIEGTDMLFITAGMGGGTGTGAISVVAQIARELNILTVAVVTKPFPFEGKRRMTVAEEGLLELNQHVDSLITIPNEKLLSSLGRDISFLEAFTAANEVLRGAVQGISELITRSGLINVDFADVRTVMHGMGLAMMGTGSAHGDNRAVDAAIAATSSPLLDDINLEGAKGILINVTCGLDMKMSEFEEVGHIVKNHTADDATVVIGAVLDDQMSGQMRVTVVATGLSNNEKDTTTGKNGYKNRDNSFERRPLEHNATAAAQPSSIRSREKNKKSAPRTNIRNDHDDSIAYLDIPAFLRKQAD